MFEKFGQIFLQSMQTYDMCTEQKRRYTGLCLETGVSWYIT